MSRQGDLDLFYKSLAQLRNRHGGLRHLRDCTGKTGWPKRGLYFFFENGEFREDGTTPRVVRVGTHAVSTGSRTTLWDRLHTHRGHSDGRGNHRGSIFRKRVGEALLHSGAYPDDVRGSWGQGSSAPKAVRVSERHLETEVSRYIGDMPLLWLEVDDEASKSSKRGYLERHTISLLSNFEKTGIDAPSKNWLGLASGEATIRLSGLWNTNHVDEDYDPIFLTMLKAHIP